MEGQKQSQMISAAIMKYKLGLSQSEIASRMNVSPMTVSRLLDSALEQGIISISIKTSTNENHELEGLLRNIYSLKDALVITPQVFEDVSVTLANSAAKYIDLVLTDSDTLGIAAGRTLSNILPLITLPFVTQKEKFKVIQLQGGLFSTSYSNPVMTLTYFVNRFNAFGFMLQQPMYAPDMEVKRLIETKYMNSFEKEWKECTAIITGVGAFGNEIGRDNSTLLNKDDYQELLEKNAVGDLFGRWFDKNGNYLDCSLNKRVISIPPEISDKVPLRILISQGDKKIDAIRGALVKKRVNVLITDEATARKLI